MTDKTAVDEETRNAVAALAHRLRARDAMPPEERPDPEYAAGEFIAALRLRGWRPTPARPQVGWARPPGGRGADPERHADLLRKARADCRAASARLMAAARGPVEGRDRGEEPTREDT